MHAIDQIRPPISARALEQAMEHLPLRKVLFLRSYLKGSPAAKAAQEAGYATRSARTTAWRLLRSTDVKEALDKVRSCIAQDMRVSIESMMRRLDDDHELATKIGDHNAMLRATELKLKLAGYA